VASPYARVAARRIVSSGSPERRLGGGDPAVLNGAPLSCGGGLGEEGGAGEAAGGGGGVDGGEGALVEADGGAHHPAVGLDQGYGDDEGAGAEVVVGDAVRRVKSNGLIRWRGTLVYISEALGGEPVGLDEGDDGLWTVRYGPILLGLLAERGDTLIRLPQKSCGLVDNAARCPQGPQATAHVPPSRRAKSAL
jgi:hypothetical protein